MTSDFALRAFARWSFLNSYAHRTRDYGPLGPSVQGTPSLSDASRRFHTWPINVVVYHGSRRSLVLRLVSRLDAFSGYLFHT